MKTIAVIGCGWLGLPLATKLIQHGYQVIGTTTSPNKLDKLASQGIDAHILDLDTPDYDTSFLNLCDTLFLNIPPGLRSNPSGSFLKKLDRFLKKLNVSTINKVVYINSTGLYPSAGVFDEQISITPDSEKGKELLESETLISNKFPNTSILRLGGLFGPDRHPSRFVRSAKQLENNSTANLIHLDDVVNLSFAVLTHDSPHIINGVHPHHPDKFSFYKKAHESADKNFPYPAPTEFTERIIDMKSTVSNFKFKHESLYDYL